MKNTASQVEKIISQVLNESGLPIDTAYYLILSIEKELKTIMIEAEYQNAQETEQQIEIPIDPPSPYIADENTEEE